MIEQKDKPETATLATSEPKGPGRPADINRDPICVIMGGVLFPMNVPKQVTQHPVSWITLVPLDVPEGTYPRDSYARITADCMIGTVDEITNNLREKLVRCFDTFTCSGGVIPTFGEASLDKQTAVLKNMGLLNADRATVSRSLQISHEEYDALEARRNSGHGDTPRQDAFERDALMRAVADYNSRRFRPGAFGVCGYPPTTDPDFTQKLINALTIFRDDEIVRRSNQQAKVQQRSEPNGCEYVG